MTTLTINARIQKCQKVNYAMIANSKLFQYWVNTISSTKNDLLMSLHYTRKFKKVLL